MEYKYKFTIIIPIYNAEKYIDDALESLINQEKISFEQDIQVILINDGSIDNSEEICLKYIDIYKDNIKYIKKENGGVSSARNLGIEYIEGEYVNFLDPDDKWTPNAFNKVYNFFEIHNNHIDVVACPLYFFEAAEGWHQLSYKFNRTRIINILEEYKNIQLSAPSCFIKADKVKQYRFKETLKYAEDAHFITRIILDKMKYGVVKGEKYLYRKRFGQNSALQQSSSSKEWYIDSIKEYVLDIIKYTINKLGYLPRYIQYALMYEIQWKVKVPQVSDEILKENEFELFISLLKEALKYFDDNIIMEQKHIEIEHKLFCLKIKYGELMKIEPITIPYNIQYMIKETPIFELTKLAIRIEFISIKNRELIIEGHIPYIEELNMRDMHIYAKTISDQQYDAKFIKCTQRDVYSLNSCILKKQFFTITIPLNEIYKNTTFSIFLESQQIIIRPKLIFFKYISLDSNIKNSYFIENGYCIMYNNKIFHLLEDSKKVRYGREVNFIKEILKKKQYKVAIARGITFLLKELKKKPIWVFMDRLDKADDNAEALFKYCIKQDDSIKKYFIINGDSPDFKRLKGIGKVISYGTYKQKLIMILADKVISSHIDAPMRNPFGGNGKLLRSLVSFKFVFLQHGITKDDVSSWLNRYNKNIDMLVTSAKKEYESFLLNDYYYSEKDVKLTGFPRYDYLEDKNNKQIVIMPTWRNSLVNKMDSKGHIEYCDTFKESEYFNQYNKLINDERIINKAKKMGYKILFMPHPNTQSQISDFNKNEDVIFVPYNTSYNKLFCESSLLVTDYSSVAFDFAYMKKPVVYNQFDYDDILGERANKHIYKKGYFDYEDMGFGPVVYQYEDAVNAILNYIDNNCLMENIYRRRVDEFYEYTDKNNCKRVYEEINNIEKK